MAEDKPGRRRKLNPVEVLHCIHAREGQSQRTYRALIRIVLGSSESAIHQAIGLAVTKGWIRLSTKGKQKLYALTEKGKSMVDRAGRAFGACSSGCEKPARTATLGATSALL